MSNYGNELFLLMANLSQYKKEKTVLRIFLESLNNLFPHLDFTFREEPNEKDEHFTVICTKNDKIGYIHYKGNPKNDELAHIQNATQTLAVILQNLRQQKLLNNEKSLLQETVENRTQELRESEEKYRHLYETMAEGVIYQNAEGNIISANPAAEKILGLSTEQLQGKTSMDPEWKSIREDGTDLPGDQHAAMIALKTGKKVENFLQGLYNPLKKDSVWMIVNSIPLFKEGENKPYQVYSTFLEIT